MSYRTISVNGRNWKWKVGKTHVDIRNPDGKGYRPLKTDLGESVQRDPDDATLGDALVVSPRRVHHWIENHAG